MCCEMLKTTQEKELFFKIILIQNMIRLFDTSKWRIQDLPDGGSQPQRGERHSGVVLQFCVKKQRNKALFGKIKHFFRKIKHF